MKLHLLIIFTLVLGCSIFGQTGKLQPNQWKGLTLDESTAEEVLEKFGKPKTERVEKVVLPVIGKLLTKELKQKKWRTMHYAQLEEAKNAAFAFDEKNRLVIIYFEAEALSPQAVVNSYDVAFKPIYSTLVASRYPKDYGKDVTGNVYAKWYPAVYYLFGTADKNLVVASIDNSAFKTILKQTVGIRPSNLFYPGNVVSMLLISRSLEDKDNSEILK